MKKLKTLCSLKITRGAQSFGVTTILKSRKLTLELKEIRNYKKF